MTMGEHRSGCPIATTLEIVGDRWTLVILRDLVNGKRRYSEFLSSPERITTNILADRLGKMEQAGLVERRLYQTRPRRFDYVLTRKGAGLHPLLVAMCEWANTHYPGTWVAPESFMDFKPAG
jgi:DNA-binding HxlR family transcriptional regulator